MICKDVVDSYYAGEITLNEMGIRILIAYDANTDIQEVVDKLEPEEAVFLRRMVEGTVFEGGISINCDRDLWTRETLVKFKQFYGFEVPGKWLG